MHTHATLRLLPRHALVLLAAAALAACAGGPATRSGPADPADLEALSEQRWAHLIAGEFAEAWAFFSPGYRTVKPQAEYAQEMKNRPVQWNSAEYVSHECPEPERCKVRVNIHFRIRMAVTGVGEVDSSRVISEDWIFLGGQWVYLPPEAVR